MASKETDRQLAEAMQALGLERYLPKPFRSSSLFHAEQSLVEQAMSVGISFFPDGRCSADSNVTADNSSRGTEFLDLGSKDLRIGAEDYWVKTSGSAVNGNSGKR